MLLILSLPQIPQPDRDRTPAAAVGSQMTDRAAVPLFGCDPGMLSVSWKED
jgi:hypothetical protein